MTTTPAERVQHELATRPKPNVPTEVELGEAVGAYGTPTSKYVGRALRRANQLSSDKLTTANIEKMRRHYQIASCLVVQSMPLLRADWSIECEDEDVAAQLTEAYALVAADVARTMARALTWGFSPNGLTWDFNPDLGMIVVTEVRDLVPSTCEPDVDDDGDFIGFTQRPGIVAANAELSIDALECLWIVEGLESGQYKGRSILDAALEPWADFRAVNAMMLRRLERFGEPVVKSRAPKGTSVANQAEIQTAVARGETPPDPVIVDNLQNAQTVGENLRHHSVLSLPADPLVGPDGKTIGWQWDVEYLESSAGGSEEFLQTLRDLAQRMARGMFVPDLLTTNDAAVGSNALGQTHRGVWELSVEGRLDEYGRQISDQVIDRMRLWNFGPNVPAARIVFAPPSERERDKLWALLTSLVDSGELTPDGEAIASELGIAVVSTDPAASTDTSDDTPDEDDVTDQDTDEDGAVDTQGAARPRLVLGVDPVAGVPDYKLPQSYDPPPRRKLNDREARVQFDKLETGLNRIEQQTISNLDDLLNREHDRVLRQLDAILRRGGTPAEVIAALSTVDLKGTPSVSSTWANMMGEVADLAIETLTAELSAYDLPDGTSPADRALFKAFASTAADRVMSQVTSDVRTLLMNAYTSQVSRAGMASVVAQVFDEYTTSEGKGPRLTTRMLSARAMNYQRAAQIERAGVPLAGAQWSAVLDRRTCDFCKRQDEQVIAIESLDVARFTPPVHFGCRCLWVWITRDEADFTPTWSTPPKSLIDRYAGLVF